MDYYLTFPPNMDLTDYYWIVLVMATLLLVQAKVAMDADYKKIVEEQGEVAEENIVLKQQIRQLEEDFKERYDEFVAELKDIMDKFNAVTTEAKMKEEKAARDMEFMRNILMRARKLQDLDENPIYPINPVPPPYRQPPPLTRTSSLRNNYTTGK